MRLRAIATGIQESIWRFTLTSLTVFCLFVSSVVIAEPVARRSSQMTGFDIQRCSDQECFHASGKKAAVALTGESMVASPGRLELTGRNGEKTQTLECATLLFEMTDQFLTCDNRQVSTAKVADREKRTLTINADFQIRVYR